MSGALTHLVAIDPQSNLTRWTTTNAGSLYTNESIIIDLDNLDNMVNRIPRISDSILPEYLMVDMNAQPIENTIEYIMSNYNLIFTMGGTDMTIPFQMMDYLEKPTMTRQNKFKIPINFNYFFGNNDGFPILSLSYHEISVNVEHCTNRGRLNNVKLICKGKYIDTEERRILASNGHQYKSRDITTLQLESTTSQKNFNIYGNGILGGIVLRINNPDTTIENIQCIEFLINGHTRHRFDMDLIDTHCQRLTDKSIYIPMNLDGNLRSEINSNAFNLSRIDDFKIEITTNLNSGFNITAYSIQPNLYRVASGMISKVFIFNLSLNIPHTIDRRPAPLPISSPGVIQWIVGKIDFQVLPDVMCPIRYEPIDISKGVCKCNQCNNIFGYNAFKQWISKNRMCPLCRNTNIENKYYTISGKSITTLEPVTTLEPMAIARNIFVAEPYFPPDVHID